MRRLQLYGKGRMRISHNIDVGFHPPSQERIKSSAFYFVSDGIAVGHLVLHETKTIGLIVVAITQRHIQSPRIFVIDIYTRISGEFGDE